MGAPSGMLPISQQSVSSTSSSASSSSSSSQFTSPTLHSTGGQSRIYTREHSLRGSSSLQDFSAYRTGSLPTGVPRVASLAGAFGSSPLPPNHQASRNDGGVALTSIKSNHSRRSSGSVIPLFYNNGVCTRGRLLSLVALVGAVLFLGFLWGRYSGGGGEQQHLEYAVVIDCGSTGTRVYVYGWTHDSIGSLPVMLKPTRDKHGDVQSNDGPAPSLEKGKRQGDSRLYNRMETEPGLDKLLHNESGVAAAIEPLIHWATKQIPRTAQKKAKVFFLATAGLRRLPVVDSRWLLDKAWSSLVRSPFMCKREWVRIISGQEEAYYGWIALNYNYNKLGFPSNEPTLGALDLGGSSLEVTFEPRQEIPKAEFLVNVSVGATNHHLYAHSHAGFGLNDAFEKSVAMLIEGAAISGQEGRKASYQIAHPCLNLGYKQPYTCSSHCLLPPLAYPLEPHGGRRKTLAAFEPGPKVELVGQPDWDKCQSLVMSVINMSGPSQGKDCKHGKCALGKYQPQPQGHFLALAGFFVVFKFFGLTSTNSLDDLLLKGQQFCELEWEQARQSVVSQPSIDRYCFRAPYVAALLRHGLHLRDEQVAIGSGDFAWTLGAALNEAGALLPAKPTGGHGSTFWGLGQSGFALGVHSFTFLFVLVFLVILLLFVFGRWTYFHVRHRPYIPLFVPPSVSNGPFSWFPPTFRSQLKSGDQSGEGRLKQPHSPAPNGPKSFHHQMFESGDMHAGGDGPVLECDVLHDPSSSGVMTSVGRSQLQLATLKMQQKGGSQLQSRRSQSREDLSAYVSPDIKMLLTRELSPVRVFTPLRHDFTI
ncbi:unnamed protein product [Calypogeia fissa]